MASPGPGGRPGTYRAAWRWGEIAATLHLSLHTVRGYAKAIFEKVGVASRGELTAKLFADHYARYIEH